MSCCECKSDPLQIVFLIGLSICIVSQCGHLPKTHRSELLSLPASGKCKRERLHYGHPLPLWEPFVLLWIFCYAIALGSTSRSVSFTCISYSLSSLVDKDHLYWRSLEKKRQKEVLRIEAIQRDPRGSPRSDARLRLSTFQQGS